MIKPDLRGLDAAITVRVIAGAAGVVCAVPEAGSAIASSNHSPVVLNSMIASQVYWTIEARFAEWQVASSCYWRETGSNGQAKRSWWPSGPLSGRSVHNAG
jgi:hypothetical protein